MGVLLAKGQFIAFLDPDDYISKHTLEKLAIGLSLNPQVTYMYPGTVHFGEYNFRMYEDFNAEKLKNDNFLPSFSLIRK